MKNETLPVGQAQFEVSYCPSNVSKGEDIEQLNLDCPAVIYVFFKIIFRKLTRFQACEEHAYESTVSHHKFPSEIDWPKLASWLNITYRGMPIDQKTSDMIEMMDEEDENYEKLKVIIRRLRFKF